jgi:hypothetical protein
MTRKKANWICHILLRNCFLKHVIDGKIKGRVDMKVRRGRRRKKLLGDLKKEKTPETERGSTISIL